MGLIKKLMWKLLDWIVRSLDARTLDKLRAIVPIWIKRFLSRFLTKNTEESTEILTTKFGLRFVSITEPVFLQVRYEGEYERQLSDLTRKLVHENDTVVDIGANFGWYSLLMANAVGPNGQVFSFEPNRVIHDVARQNIALNQFEDRITLTNCGIGEKSETGTLLANSKESAVGYFSTKRAGGEVNSGEPVELHPLDEMVENNIDNISFIKIDVEGFEPFVLRGARKVLAGDNPPIIMMEFNIEALERSSTHINQFIGVLNQLGITAVSSENGVKIIDKIRHKNANLFFFPTRGRYAQRLGDVQ